jgi:hypothetical protein
MRISTGKVPSAQKILCYGPEGIGKSTFAALFPDPLFVDIEGSTKHMDVKRLDTPSSWTMLIEQVIYVRLHPDVCQTLVIDTADWAEALCTSHVCAKAQKDGIEDFGYGKGYAYLAEEFGNLLNLLTEVIGLGIHVVLTAHAQIRKFEQPDEAAAYDRWELKLQKKTAPLVKEWADMVLFVNYKTFVVKDAKTQKATAQGGKRVMYTSHTPAWDAKNRHDLPDELPFDKNKLVPALASAIVFEKPAVVAPVPTPERAECFFAGPCDSQRDNKCIAPFTCQSQIARADKGGPGYVTAPGGSVKQEPTIEAPGPTDVPLHLKALFDLMAQNAVTEADIRSVVADRGYFPVATPLEKYPADFVEGVLIGAWPQVMKGLADLKSVPFK